MIIRQTNHIYMSGFKHLNKIGAGQNIAEARQPAELNIKGKKIAWASYSLTFPQEFWATDTSGGACFPFDTFFFNDVRKFKKENDIVVISFHWGGELMKTPKDYQVLLAHQTIDCGADLVIGHHPHVVQGIEIYKGKAIVYSLGNFIFGSYSENVKESMLISLNYNTTGIAGCRIYPINVYNKEVEFQPSLLEGNKKAAFLSELDSLSLELNNQRDVMGEDAWIRF